MTAHLPNALKVPSFICGSFGFVALVGAAVANELVPPNGSTRWPATLLACALLLWVVAFLLWLGGTHPEQVASDQRDEFVAAQRLAFDPAGLTAADQMAIAALDIPAGDLDDLIRVINTHVAQDVPAPRHAHRHLATAERRQAPAGVTADQISTARALVYSATPAELDNAVARQVAAKVVGLLLDLGWRPQAGRP